jgi:hypothetical protein
LITLIINVHLFSRQRRKKDHVCLRYRLRLLERVKHPINL